MTQKQRRPSLKHRCPICGFQWYGPRQKHNCMAKHCAVIGLSGQEPWWAKNHWDVFRALKFHFLKPINAVYLAEREEYYFMIEQAWAQSNGLA